MIMLAPKSGFRGRQYSGD